MQRGDFERQLRKYGRVTVTCTCLPYEFAQTGKQRIALPASGKVANPFDEARPVYEISGEGVCELTVNGSAMSANVGQNLTIDTARQCAYRTDGTVQNTVTIRSYIYIPVRTPSASRPASRLGSYRIGGGSHDPDLRGRQYQL